MELKEALKKVKARIKCEENEILGNYEECNKDKCEGCSLCYEQGNMGERREALKVVVSAAEQSSWVPVSEGSPKEHTCDEGFIEPSEYVLVQIPKDATNGDVIRAAFPKAEVIEKRAVVMVGISRMIVFDLDWWNAPYKAESEGTDADSN